jgi:hypothetical protein
MNEILIILACFSGIFTFAFGMASCLPLIAAGVEERKTELKPTVRDIADIWFILNDMIPIFLAIDLFRKAPQDYSAAKKKWKSDGMIRTSSYISILSGLTTWALTYLLFQN